MQLQGQTQPLLDKRLREEVDAQEGAAVDVSVPGVAEPLSGACGECCDSAGSCAVQSGGLGRVVRGSRGVVFGSLGVVSVGLGAIGAVLPVMPTTVFLVAACWCFARSNPALERRLVRNRFFGPFLGFIDSGSGMPMRAKVVSLSMMWGAIGVSGVLLVLRGVPLVAPLGTVVLGAVGTWMILRVPTAPQQRSRERSSDPFDGVFDGP